jgi:hypothetical protein
MGAPFVAITGRTVRRIAIGGEVARYFVAGRAGLVGERHVHPVIQERIRIVVRLLGLRAIEGERDLVPLFEFATYHSGGVQLGGGGAKRARHEDRSKQVSNHSFNEVI